MTSIRKRYQFKRWSSKSHGITFTLTFAQYKELIKQNKCAYTGVVLKPSEKTIDRIDNKKGYEPGNVVIASLFANQYKAFLEDPNVPEEKKLSFSFIKKVMGDV